MTAQGNQERAEKLDPGGVGKAEDLAGAIAFLASDDAAFIKGAAPALTEVV